MPHQVIRKRVLPAPVSTFLIEQSPWNHRLTPFVLSIAVIGVDLLAGQSLRVSSFFVIPVLLAGWNYHARSAIALVLILCVWRVGLECYWNNSESLRVTLFNAANRGVVLIALSVVTSILARNTRLLRERVAVLEGLLPICCDCKSIRDEEGDWQRIERYIEDRTTAKFSHGYCPKCFQNFLRREGVLSK